MSANSHQGRLRTTFAVCHAVKLTCREAEVSQRSLLQLHAPKIWGRLHSRLKPGLHSVQGSGGIVLEASA